MLKRLSTILLFKKTDEGNPFRLKFNFRENLIVLLLFISATIAIFFSAAILYTLWDGAYPFFAEYPLFDFLFGTLWIPFGQNPVYGVLPLVAGTLVIAFGALLIGVPLGVAAAIYLSEFASPRVRNIVKPIIELLAGIPSIVFGLFALLFISPILQENFGYGFFNAGSAIIVIGIMIMPIVITISDDAMKAIPRHYRESSFALGATKWETAIKIVMPAASSGIMASILLSLARAIGETMVVLMVCGGIPIFFGEGPLGFTEMFDISGPMITMSGYIGKIATGDMIPGLNYYVGFAVGILLFIMTYIINTIGGQIVIQVKTGTTVKSKKMVKKTNKFRKPFVILKSKLLSLISYLFFPIKYIISFLKKIFLKSKPLTLKRRYLKQKIGISLLATSIIIAGAFLVILLGFLVTEGIGEINWRFLTAYPSWRPEKAGIFPVILGSVYLMVLTVVFSAPLGIGAAIYLNEFARDTFFTRLIRRIIQNLAGVPSIVFGLLGYIFFATYLGFGFTLLTGSIVLTIMILPIIVVATEESLRAVPDSFRQAALGVGSTRWQTVRYHVLPNAIPGILTGLILSMSRAIGETAPILFIVSYTGKTAPTAINDGFMAMPAQIFYWAQQPKQIFQTYAISTALVLLIILLGMNAFAIFIRYRTQKKRDW